VIVPSVSPTKEKLWSYQDLLGLRAVHWLRMRKPDTDIPASPMPEVRRVLAEVVESGKDPWEDFGARICVDRGGHTFVDREEGMQTNAYRQGAWDHGDKVCLMDAIGNSPGLVRPSKGLRINPNRLSGEPHIHGTRIGTLNVSSLAEDGYAPDRIARLYELPVERVREAIDYEKGLAA
jgi:uncharacterized protein (DUF433 family)